MLVIKRNKIILLSVFTLMEEHRLRISEKRVLRIIFGPKKDEVTTERRK
jgi:hypothetical protein